MSFQTTYSLNQPVFRIGQVNALVRSVTGVNNAGEVAQVSRGVVGTTLGWTTGATITAGSFVFTQVGSATGETALTFAQNAANRINSSIAFNDVFATAIGNGTNAATLTVTSRQPGNLGTFTFSVVPNVANAAGTIAGVAPSAATVIPFGAFVSRLLTDGTGTIRQGFAGTTTAQLLGAVSEFKAYEQDGRGFFVDNADPTDGIPRSGNAQVVAQGDMVVRTAQTLTVGTGAYVHTATGFLTSDAAAGLLIPGLQVRQPSITLESGLIATLVSINLPQ